MTPTIRYITPCHEELVKFISNVKCVMEGCHKKLSTTSALRFHLIYGHGLDKNDSRVIENCPGVEQNVAYFCPVETCKHSSSSGGRPITTLRRIKTHYISCHMEKVFTCIKCGSKFATEKKLNYHQKDCGIKFVCSCNVAYSGRQGLMAHIRKSKHQKPPKFSYLWKNKKCKKDKLVRVPLLKKATSILLPRGNPISAPLIKMNQERCQNVNVIVQPKQLSLPIKEKVKILLPKNNKRPVQLQTVECSVQTDHVDGLCSTACTQTDHGNFLDELVEELEKQSPSTSGHDMSCQTFDWNEQFAGHQQQVLRQTMPSSDFGIQTDMENVLDELLLSSMATQTTSLNNIMESETYISNSTTQTDKYDSTFDILSSLEPSKSTKEPLLLPNDNNNSNIGFNYSQETQTRFNATQVETQTSVATECFNTTSNSTDYFDFLNNNATQTDLLTYTNSTSSQTQPLESDSFLVDFLNMETQTDNSCFSQF